MVGVGLRWRGLAGMSPGTGFQSLPNCEHQMDRWQMAEGNH